MGRRRRLEEELADLRAVDTTTPDGRSALEAALRSRQSHVVALAARRVGEAGLPELAPALTAAFSVFLEEPVKRDPGCSAKAAIAQVLDELGVVDDTVFRLGVSHRQLEPSWGPPVDTASTLRSRCCLAMARLGYPGTLDVLADRLADEVAAVRIDAARAVAWLGALEGTALLRLKLRLGDPEAEVTAEVIGALIELDAPAGLDLAADLLREGDALHQELAALAVGESRRPEGVPILKRWWERTIRLDLRRTGLLAIALVRSDDAIDLLLDLVSQAPEIDALDALHALRLLRHDAGLAERIVGAATRDDVDLRQAVSRALAEDADAPDLR